MTYLKFGAAVYAYLDKVWMVGRTTHNSHKNYIKVQNYFTVSTMVTILDAIQDSCNKIRKDYNNTDNTNIKFLV